MTVSLRNYRFTFFNHISRQRCIAITPLGRRQRQQPSKPAAAAAAATEQQHPTDSSGDWRVQDGLTSAPTPLLDAVLERGDRLHEVALHVPGHKVGTAACIACIPCCCCCVCGGGGDNKGYLFGPIPHPSCRTHRHSLSHPPPTPPPSRDHRHLRQPTPLARPTHARTQRGAALHPRMRLLTSGQPQACVLPDHSGKAEAGTHSAATAAAPLAPLLQQQQQLHNPLRYDLTELQGVCAAQHMQA